MRQAFMINATMPVGWLHELNAAVQMPFVVGIFERQHPFTHGRERFKALRRPSGQYLTVRNNDSEYGLSLLTLGRL